MSRVTGTRLGYSAVAIGLGFFIATFIVDLLGVVTQSFRIGLVIVSGLTALSGIGTIFYFQEIKKKFPIPKGSFEIWTQSGAKYKFGAADRFGTRNVEREGENPHPAFPSVCQVSGTAVHHILGVAIEEEGVIEIGKALAIKAKDGPMKNALWGSTSVEKLVWK